MMKQSAPQSSAFTLVELLVVIAVLAVIVALQLPVLANTQAKVQRVNCSGNLKQVGIAFRTWAANNNGRMPMQVPRASRGAMEAVGFASTASWTTGNVQPFNQVGVWWMFMVMSNELSTPKILYCPSDIAPSHNASGAIHVQATVFGMKTTLVEGFQNDYNVSYFVGVDATELRPDMLLAGDHNLGTGVNQTTKTPQFTSAGTNSVWTANAIGWQDNNHGKQGNVAFADGSVQNLTTDQFRTALNKTGDTGRSASVFVLTSGSTGSGVNRLQFP